MLKRIETTKQSRKKPYLRPGAEEVGEAIPDLVPGGQSWQGGGGGQRLDGLKGRRGEHVGLRAGGEGVLRRGQSLSFPATGREIYFS
jgi:hypothetical protein